MTKKSDELRKVVNDLLQQATDQLDEIRGLMTRSRDRFEADFHRLKLERDKLLQRLGEQTLKLSNQGKMNVPKVIRRTVDHLNDILDRLGNLQSGKKKKKAKSSAKKAPAKASAKKPAAPAEKKAETKPAKKAAKKVTKKAPKKTTKKAAKETTKKAAKKTTKKVAKKTTKKVAKKKPATAKKAKKAAKRATKKATSSKK